MEAKIDDEKVEIVKVVNYGHLPMIVLDDGREYYVAQDSNYAGEKAREYWAEMAQGDPKEFACIVSEEVLVAWALGQSAGPGSTSVNSLDEWLDLTATVPEEHFASYDGAECELESTDKELASELNLDYKLRDDGEIQCVAYRHN